MSSDTTEVNELPLPDASFTTSSSFTTLEFFSTSQPGVTYEWDFGDGTTGVGPEVYHIYNWKGLFTVTLTAYNDCDTVTVEQEVESRITTGVEELANGASINIFPNPNNGQFNLAVNVPEQASVSYQVLDVQGAIVGQGVLGNVQGERVQNVQLSNLSAGMYLMRVQVGTSAKVVRMSIK